MTVTITEDKQSGIHKIKFVVTSDSDGNASGTTTKFYNGVCLRAIFDPDASSTQPTDAYDVVINDDDGYDVLHGCGANLSNAANVYKTNSDGLACMRNSQLSLVASNMGDVKGAVVYLYLAPFNNAW